MEEILNDLNPKHEKETTQFLNVNDQNLANPIEIANAFNTHFTNIIKRIRQGSDPNTDIKISDTLKEFLYSKLPENELFHTKDSRSFDRLANPNPKIIKYRKSEKYKIIWIKYKQIHTNSTFASNSHIYDHY